MGSRVRVLNVSHVRPDQTTNPTPPPHTDHHAAITLSFFDAFYVARPPMQRLFFYEGPGLPPFPSLVRSLQSSLAATLAVFLPLAGRLDYCPYTGDVFIDCSPAAVSCGVRFVEAEYAGTIDDMHRLAGGDEHHTEALMQLGPDTNAARLPIPVLAVQVTRPAGDGAAAVVVGVTVHHAAADGHSVWQFMRAWSAASREGLPTAPELTFHRTAIRHPKAVEVTRKTLRTVAPALPVARSPSSCSPLDQRRRTFHLAADQIKSLKEKILLQSIKATDGDQTVAKHPSTYVAVSSLAWTSIVRAKPLDHVDDVYYMVTVDCRRRLVPLIDEGYFGNCVKCCFARAAVGDLRGDAALARAAAAIQSVVVRERSVGDPLADVERWLESFLAVPRDRLTMAGSSNRFMAYDETDYGWGAPSRVELVSTFTRETVLLLGAADGGVQVTVALDHAHMDGFVANFLQA